MLIEFIIVFSLFYLYLITLFVAETKNHDKVMKNSIILFYFATRLIVLLNETIKYEKQNRSKYGTGNT